MNGFNIKDLEDYQDKEDYQDEEYYNKNHDENEIKKYTEESNLFFRFIKGEEGFKFKVLLREIVTYFLKNNYGKKDSLLESNNEKKDSLKRNMKKRFSFRKEI